MPGDLRLRRGVQRLATRADDDLTALWNRVSDAARAREALNDILPAIIATYGTAAATLAADWYDDLRARSGARGRFVAIPAEIPDVGVPALLRWAYAKATDDAMLRVLVSGGAQRRIANFPRHTVIESAIADPAADGWQRVGVGDNCPFCNMLIGRGAVYSEATVSFGAHDHCNCYAQPAFRGGARPVQPYTPSDRISSEADRARTREWIRINLPPSQS